MAISRVPGYSLLANLDRQGTDISLTSSGLTLQYWDVTNYRVGINNSAPQQELDVSGNILTSNGHVYTNANISFDIGNQYNWWRTVYTESIQSVNLTGTLLTNSQPNITSLGTLANLSVVGNLSVDGNLIVDGVTVGNLSANNIVANVFGNLTGYVLQGDQPFITSLSNITVSNITITGGEFDFGGDVSFEVLHSDAIFQNNNPVLDSVSNIQITGDTVGYGVYSNINVTLVNTGVVAGTYGADGIIPQIGIDSKGRILSASNIAVTKIGNLTFSNSSITSNTDLTISTITNGNIYLDAGSTGVVQFVGSDAVGLPSGDDSTRPLYPGVGYTRYNTDRQSIEYYDGNSWLAPGAATISSEVINPDGSANTYTLGSNTTVDSVLVSINGTLQQPIYSYNIVNNNQITFTEVPLTSDVIEVRFIAVSATSVSSLRYGPVTAVALDLANVNVTGNLLPSANVTYDLGSPTLRWRTGYFSANTIDIGGGTIGLHDTLGFTFTTPGGEPQYMMPNGASTSNTFTSSTVTIQGNLAVSGNITTIGNVSGQYILGSAQFLTGLPVGYSNVNTKAYTESMGFANYSNVNLSAYLGGSFGVGTITGGTWTAGTIGVLYGGTGATTTSGVGGALDNLLPSGEQTGYVLSTSGAGTYSWVAPSAGGTTVGQSLTTLRQSNAIVSNTTIINLAGISYTPGAGQLRVYINGVRQFPSAYTETSNISYTLSANVVSGDSVFTEIDAFSSFNNYANLTYASNVGNIAASGLTVQAAIESLENNKAPLAHPVFSGVTTIGGNLVVQGNLFVNGNTTTINANNLTINDSLIYLADDNPADTLDIGLVSAFTNAIRYQHTGFVRDATDGVWKLFANVVPEPGSTVDFTNATYSNLQIGNLSTTSATVSGNIVFTGWSIRETGTKLYFAYNGVNKMSLDTGGNLVVTGDITAFGTIT